MDLFKGNGDGYQSCRMQKRGDGETNKEGEKEVKIIQRKRE